MQDAASHHDPLPVALLTPLAALRRDPQLEGTLAAAHAPAGPGARQEVLQRQGFRIGPLGLMIRYEDGSELADLPPTYCLPNAPDWFVGIVNLHGVLIPVFDLALYLGIELEAGRKPMLLVLAHGPEAAGVLIDGLPQRLRLAAPERVEDASVPPGLQGCVTQTCWVGERPWMDLNVQALLSKLTEELQDLGR
jgi:twitching motility protein PilI